MLWLAHAAEITIIIGLAWRKIEAPTNVVARGFDVAVMMIQTDGRTLSTRNCD
jgi:hypothetical protein